MRCNRKNSGASNQVIGTTCPPADRQFWLGMGGLLLLAVGGLTALFGTVYSETVCADVAHNGTVTNGTAGCNTTVTEQHILDGRAPSQAVIISAEVLGGVGILMMIASAVLACRKPSAPVSFEPAQKPAQKGQDKSCFSACESFFKRIKEGYVRTEDEEDTVETSIEGPSMTSSESTAV